MSQQYDPSTAADDLPIFQYARLKGLSRDHLAEPFPWPQIMKLQENVPHCLLDDPELPYLNLESLTANLSDKERLILSKEGARLLATTQRGEDDVDAPSSLSNLRKAKWIKLELPLLITDHEWDCRQFARREDFEPQLGDIKLPEEVVDEDSGEGFTIPLREWDLSDGFMESIQSERLVVRRDTLNFLREVVKGEWTDADEEELCDRLRYKRNLARESVTPPLLPMSSSVMDWEPNSSELEIPLLSDPASDTREKLNAMEEELFKEDLPGPMQVENSGPPSFNHRSSGELNSEKIIWETSSNQSDLRITRPIETKVEGPLTPVDYPATPKTVRFSDSVELFTISPNSTPNVMEDSFFEEAFGEAAAQAARLSEQEKLAPQDSKARVPVPLMDFRRPEPPWRKIENQHNKPCLGTLQRQMLADIVGNGAPPLTGLLRLHSKLPWAFPQGARTLIEETPCFEDDSIWEKHVFWGEDDIVDISSLVSKPPGLMILRDDDDSEDEFKPGDFDIDKDDLTVIGRKRKWDSQQNNDSETVRDKSNQTMHSDFTNTTLPSYTKGAAKHKPNPEDPDDLLVGQSLLLGTKFSAANAISNFQVLRGTKKQALAHSSYFHTPKDAATAFPSQSAAPVSGSRLVRNTTDTQTAQIDLPSPALNSTSMSTSIITSAAFIQRRSLVRHIRELLPNLKFLVRELEKHNKTSWLPGSVSRSPIISPLTKEADLIVSPSTGIILTTFPKVKQRLLPGQKGRPAVQEYVELVSQRYERLIIIVSADNSTNDNNLSDSDALAFSGFLGFTAGLACQVTTKYIPGSDAVLARWIAHSITKHCIPSDGSTLLEDETSWELFLRRAGMNVFAAQCIILALKAPEGINEKSPLKISLFGLTAFVEMSHSERVDRFGQLLGGTTVLERFDKHVHTLWE
ncbi:hypothetical protein BP6252_08438 [Coleophoma cylindrospora]|uniref:Uncharacterized protein n=1 Tax=Coleophoma cylindrospora TaxID=1849047 RepID=A0A3D8R632_9HELO|nr:hypothetical protein BP6252_08438 [Coleophoma cylindrospora]